MKICIDPGHGGSEPGCSGFGKIEKSLNLEYGAMLRNELLEYENTEVILTRDSDHDLGLTQRCNIANNYKADLFISCHLNAFNGAARGTEVIYSVYSNQSFKDFCNYLSQTVANKLNIPCRGSYSRKSTNGSGDYYTVIHNTDMKAIIIEPLFLDNSLDNKAYNPYAIAETIAKVVADHYGLKSKAVIYAKGSKGPMVSNIQGSLNNFLESLKLSVDGDFGPLTEHIVKLYQQEKGLSVDGIVGPGTLKSLGL